MRKPSEVGRRRRFVRLPVSLPVIAWVPAQGGQELRGTLRRVGAGGLEVEFPEAVKPGTTLRVRLRTRDGPVEVEAKVVFARPAGNAIRHGLAFPEPKPPGFAMDLFLAEAR